MADISNNLKLTILLIVVNVRLHRDLTNID